MMAGNTHVPDKLYGYTLQVRHMMYELISLDLEKVVSVEALEDVAIESKDSVVAEQIKSVQSNNNPIADRSEVFWKTLYNWHQYIENGDLQLGKTTFRFIVISDRNTVAGRIPTSFHAASTAENAKTALIEAKNTLWGTEGELKAKVPNGYASYLEILFNDDNINTVSQIIGSMQIEIHKSDYDDALFTKFVSLPIPPEYADDLFLYMLGWVYEQVNNQIKCGLPAYLKCKNFRDELQSQIRRYNQNGILASVATCPGIKETQKELARQDTYIKQLGFVEVDISDKLKAASDFLRTSAEKTAWAERGIVAPQSFDDYYEGIIRIWNTQSRLVSLTTLQTDIKDGQRLYFICQDAVRTAKVQGNETPEFFGSGSLHALANEPAQVPLIGWHPMYKDLLKAEGDNNE